MVCTSSTIVIYSVGIFLLISNQFDGVKSENELKWEAEFDNGWRQMDVAQVEHFGLTIRHLNTSYLNETKSRIQVVSSNFEILRVGKEIPLNEIEFGTWRGSFSAWAGHATGRVNVTVQIIRGNEAEVSSQFMFVEIHRNTVSEPENAYIFIKLTYVTTLMILYGCFGAVLNLKEVKSIFKSPRGLSLAFALNFVILPLVSCIFSRSNLN